MDLTNPLFANLIKFMANKDQDLVFLVKFLDFILCGAEINAESELHIQTYINSTRIVNNLYVLLRLTVNLTDKERKAYDDAAVIDLADNPERIAGFQAFKRTLHDKYNPELIELFEEYREGKF